MPITKKSTWEEVKAAPSKPLKGSVHADVAIVGGGLAGVLAAYMLAKAGKKVAIIESDRVGAGVTSYTTAFLTCVVDTDLTDLISMYGTKKARQVWESHSAGIDLLEKIIKSEKIDCEFARCDNYVYAVSPKDFEALEEEKKAADKIDFKTRLVKSPTLGFENSGAWVIPKQGKFHATKFLASLTAKIKKMGVQVFEKSEVTEIVEEEGKHVEVVSKKGKVLCHQAIVATYQPFNNPSQVLFKKGMYRSYVFEVKIPAGAFKEGLYEDTKNPYNYFRVDRGGKHDRMIIGGQDHRNELSLAEKSYGALEEYLKQIMGSNDYKIVRAWDSQVLEPSDGLALIGETTTNQYVATAFSGNGMTYSAIASMLLTDLIMGRSNPWTNVYDPKRIPTFNQLARKGRDYAEEFIKGAGKNLFKPKKGKFS